VTLLIACILIYQFNMDWWWYGVAIFVYLGHIYYQVTLQMEK